MTPSNITRRLAQLIQQGLVVKHRDPNDGRAWVVELTPAGLELVPRLQKRLVQVNAQVFADLSAAQRETLAELLSQVNQNLAK